MDRCYYDTIVDSAIRALKMVDRMDLKNPKWMYAKAAMFVVIGAMVFALVLMEQPSLRTAAFLILMIWAFCRAYYFAFYVIGKYIDPAYRFSGLVDFVGYLWRRQKSGKPRE